MKERFFMTNPKLYNSRGVPQSLSNLLTTDKNTYFDILDAVEDSHSATELQYKLNEVVYLHKFVIDRKTKSYVRLVSTDKLGNKEYFIAEYTPDENAEV